MIHKRVLFDMIINHLPAKEFSIITGPRQSGKTTLLQQIAGYLEQKNENVYIFTLEDHDILHRLNKHPDRIFDIVRKNKAERLYLLIDEIQYLSDPSNFLKLLYDKYSPNLKIIATGSSAFYIDRKFTDSLAGRKQLFELYTLSFDEFLLFRTGESRLGGELQHMRLHPGYISLASHELSSLFDEYLTFGGYPAVALARGETEKILLLKEIMNSYLKRDITESNISDTEKFYRLMLLLAHQTGSLVNVNELTNTLRLSVTAIENYLYIMRKCFHIHLVRPFYGNVRKELIKMPKVYFHDLGLRNVLMNSFTPVFQRIDKGELVENYSFIRLRETSGLDAVRFWRTAEGHEVDFVVSHSPGSGEAIEVKYAATAFNPGKYKRFTEAYPGFPLHIRAYDADENRNKVLCL